MNDPFGIYKNEQPRVSSGGGGSGAGWLIVGLLLGLLLVLGYQRLVPPDGGGDRKQDRQDQKEEKRDQPAIAGKTLIFVHERNPQSIEHDLLLRQMPDYTKERSLAGGFRALDQDMQDEQTKAAIAFAKSKSIDPPFVLMTDQNDVPVRVIRWPDSIGGLGELFK
jgi:hypothetical protein